MTFREITFPTFFPPIQGVRYFAKNFVLNNPVTDVSSFCRSVILSVQERIYMDDTWTVTKTHFDYDKVTLIRTRQSDRLSQSKKILSFKLTEPCNVWIAYDEKGSNGKPNWLTDRFEPTAYRIYTNQGGEYRLYKKLFRSGKVTLGGNAQGVSSPGKNYFVIIESLRYSPTVITRDVVDLTIDELKLTSDYLLQLWSKGYLIHNVNIDRHYPIYLNDQNQFVQNGFSILDVIFRDGPNLAIDPEAPNYMGQEIINGPINTGSTYVFKFYDLVNGELVLVERIDPVIIPAEIENLVPIPQIINLVSFYNFLEKVNILNTGIIPFEPEIENFIPTERQPDSDCILLDFIPQETLQDPKIVVYGTNFIIRNHEAKIYWFAYRASRILLNNNREIDFQGFLSVYPTETTYYTFTAESDNEVITQNYNIQVKTTNDPDSLELPHLIFRSNTKIANPGDTITLSWEGQGFSALFLGDLDVTSLASKNEIINSNTEFTLKAFNPNLIVELKLFIRIPEERESCI